MNSKLGVGKRLGWSFWETGLLPAPHDYGRWRLDFRGGRCETKDILRTKWVKSCSANHSGEIRFDFGRRILSSYSVCLTPFNSSHVIARHWHTLGRRQLSERNPGSSNVFCCIQIDSKRQQTAPNIKPTTSAILPSWPIRLFERCTYNLRQKIAKSQCYKHTSTLYTVTSIPYNYFVEARTWPMLSNL